METTVRYRQKKEQERSAGIDRAGLLQKSISTPGWNLVAVKYAMERGKVPAGKCISTYSLPLLRDIIEHGTKSVWLYH